MRAERSATVLISVRFRWIVSRTARRESSFLVSTSRLYQLWFSSKYCESIVWWNLCDQTAYGNENQYYAGLLRYDCSEKPSYQVLDRLINKEWNTSFETTVSDELRFSGFYGDYEIEATYQGKTVVKELSLHADNTGYDNRLCDFRAKTLML